MPALSFYHLLHTPIEQALPILMQKILGGDLRVVILCKDTAHMQALDDALWAPEQQFIPHGTARDEHREEQPIYLSETLENPNNASVLVIANGAELQDFAGFERVLDMFDGGDSEQLSAARTRWKSYKAAGHPLKYIQQQQSGGWKEMASENQAA